ncbi:cysteine desulfurase [Ancylobacter dichloromethanicus]|uniref:Cysteine desulfurase n=1 Tax=Ancylobacter dichloromethanicus TaxID=518825 RepID=A0A9W6JAK3_9HYPH|nr:cysteine desulfurase family protein [Ancylobacter dichloromethanicus]MBS7555786.1 cysteine desulfurase [Ancylobacter dichloromethanicus]GLK72861.1 cysteine desulfurase [Ancylobacter dichloromethanicus]
MNQRTYLDHNATSPVRPEAREALLEALDATGNGSSVHGEGRASRATIDKARGRVAALVGAPAGGVMFTSCGTEADTLALTPDFHRGETPVTCDVLLVSAVEHAAVLRGHRFPAERVEILPVDARGRVRPDGLDAALDRHTAAGRRALVSVMVANNETGVLQPVAEVARRAHAHGALVHSDAVQAAGRMAVSMPALGVDLMSISAHKLGGAPGAGALIVADPDLRPAPVFAGGAQERGRRAGSENVPAIAAFGAAALAAAAAVEVDAARINGLRARLEDALRCEFPELVLLVGDVDRLPNTSCLALPGVPAETIVIALDLAGVAVSAGAACSSGKVAASHVLGAMGVPERIARSAIRLSFGWSSGEEDVDRALGVFRRVLPGLVRRRAAA